MREFKFRCFDKMEGYMLSWQDLLDGGDLEEMMKLGHEEDENYSRLMQYTGLKDKNGVEIYEGDIIAIGTYTGTDYIGEIEFEQGTFHFGNIPDGMCDYQEMSVIGNIYENPELL